MTLFSNKDSTCLVNMVKTRFTFAHPIRQASSPQTIHKFTNIFELFWFCIENQEIEESTNLKFSIPILIGKLHFRIIADHWSKKRKKTPLCFLLYEVYKLYYVDSKLTIRYSSMMTNVVFFRAKIEIIIHTSIERLRIWNVKTCLNISIDSKLSAEPWKKTMRICLT